MLQPRLVAAVFLTALSLQEAWPFLLLAAVLAWNAALAGLNPVDALYRALARRTGWTVPPPARAPRRAAQAIAASMALTIGLALAAGATGVAAAMEGLFALALLGLIRLRFCAGSEIYFRFRRAVHGVHVVRNTVREGPNAMH